jgi:hypothetical protein
LHINPQTDAEAINIGVALKATMLGSFLQVHREETQRSRVDGSARTAVSTKECDEKEREGCNAVPHGNSEILKGCSAD